MITVIPFVAEHVRIMRSLYSDNALGVGPDPEKFVHELQVKDLAYTAMEDGVPIGCAGLLPLWQGAAEAWALLTPKLKSKPIFLHRTVKRILYELQAKGKFHRIQCGILFDFKVGCDWARRLGFICEGPLYMYCPNKLTYKRFALLANY